MPYQDTISYLDSFINYEKKTRYRYKESFKLERIKEFLESIGNPHAGLKYIHVAGTKGKGSVCALAAYMLRQMGYSVGLYTSPHLSDVRERLRILHPGSSTAGVAGDDSLDFEGEISEEDLTRITEQLRPAIISYGETSAYGPLSFFEVYTALAFLYFKEQAVDYAVLETGLGGRLDATNVVVPYVTGIASISYDHMNKLGRTLADIASEKAGIIKSTSKPQTVISAPQEDSARDVIRARCAEHGALLYEVGRDIDYRSVSASRLGQTFAVSGIFGSFDDLRMPLLGEHQLINAAVAFGLVAQAQRQSGRTVALETLRAGLCNARWPGRCETVGEKPLIVLDGAHNEASAAALARTLRGFTSAGGVILVLGASKDKDVEGICRQLGPLAKRCIVTKADNPRAMPTSDVSAMLGKYAGQSQIVEAQTVREGLDLARGCAEPDDLVAVTGSLFIVGEARGLLTGKKR
jgi:dihydrofolate synthase / folylpolyglutamate synthase